MFITLTDASDNSNRKSQAIEFCVCQRIIAAFVLGVVEIQVNATQDFAALQDIARLQPSPLPRQADSKSESVRVKFAPVIVELSQTRVQHVV